jgi:hypothetical protein
MIQADRVGPGLQIFGNEFNGGSIWYTGTASPPQVVDTLIHNNYFASTPRATRAQMTLTGSNMSIWCVLVCVCVCACVCVLVCVCVCVCVNERALRAIPCFCAPLPHLPSLPNRTFNFCNELLFGNIASVQYSVTAVSGFVRASARPATGCTLTIETETPLTGAITVAVDSSTYQGNFV